MPEKDERIDLNKLTQRELLILNHSKLAELSDKVEKMDGHQQKMALKVNSLETKSKMWGSVTGFFSGILAAFITR